MPIQIHSHRYDLCTKISLLNSKSRTASERESKEKLNLIESMITVLLRVYG